MSNDSINPSSSHVIPKKMQCVHLTGYAKKQYTFGGMVTDLDHVTIRTKPVPRPKPDEILVKIHATTVNRTDCAYLFAEPWFMRLMTGITKPKRHTSGTDFAGIVVAVGDKSVKGHSYQAGDRVFGFNDLGLSSHGEYVAIKPSEHIAPLPTIPRNKKIDQPQFISYIEGAASLEGFHYALNFINKVTFKKNARVLVYGGSGAIGSAIVQIAKYYGGEVIAVTEKKYLTAVSDLGANKVLDYQNTDVVEKFKTEINSANSGDHSHAFDFVFDAVGKGTFKKFAPILKPGGVYISSELGSYSQNVFWSLLGIVIKKLQSYKPFNFLKKVRRVVFPIPLRIGDSLRLVITMWEQGMYRPLIDSKHTYLLNDIKAAFDFVASGKKCGNVVIAMKED